VDCLVRIKQLLAERGWSVYRLAEKSGIPQSTLSNMFNRSNYPTVPTLERICKALDVSLSEFFSESSLTPDDAQLDTEMTDVWAKLDVEQKKALLSLAKLL